MSEAIKRMLAERAMLKAKRKYKTPHGYARNVSATLAMVKRAAPFIDENCPADKWPPSTKLQLLYFVAATSPRAEAGKEALITVLELLDRARKLWVAGYYADPFDDHPRLRS